MNQKPCDCPHCLKQADVHLRKHVNLNEPSEHCYECRADSPKPESKTKTKKVVKMYALLDWSDPSKLLNIGTKEENGKWVIKHASISCREVSVEIHYQI
jgi:hypothetical protein